MFTHPLEQLLAEAARDADFRAHLLRDRWGAVSERKLELSHSQRQLLEAIPDDQLKNLIEVMIDKPLMDPMDGTQCLGIRPDPPVTRGISPDIPQMQGIRPGYNPVKGIRPIVAVATAAAISAAAAAAAVSQCESAEEPTEEGTPADEHE